MNKKEDRGLLLIILAIGLIWARSNFPKMTEGKFVNNLGATLKKSAEQNNNLWYKEFLQNFAIPNANIFANLVMWGELLVAISLIFASLYLLIKGSNRLVQVVLLLGLLGGAFLNINFWLAFGYTSASTDNLNLLMAIIEIIGVVVFISHSKNISHN